MGDIFRPQGFVNMNMEGVVSAPTERALVDLQKNSIAFRISREMAIVYGLVEPTDEERATMAAETAAFRAQEARTRSLPGPELTLESLLAALALPPTFAAHLLHDGCYCHLSGEDPSLCSWATQLGYRISYEDSGILGFEVVGP